MKSTKENGILLVYKKAGYTPLQTIQTFKKNHPQYKDVVISYAGRLDPMAEGLLLLLYGDENKKRHTYEHFSKTYEFQILFGYATDTYDVMGCITDEKTIYDEVDVLTKAHQFIKTFHGSQTLPYPPYSSKSTQGKPLYWYTIHDKLSTITIPTQNITIHSLKIDAVTHLTGEQIKHSIIERLQTVHGTFRQDNIQKQWTDVLEQKLTNSYLCVNCTLFCGHGAYVRGIVNKLSQDIQIPALTYTIKRTAIGSYTLDQAVSVED